MTLSTLYYKIFDVKFVVLTFGWVKTSLLGQDNLGTGKWLLTA